MNRAIALQEGAAARDVFRFEGTLRLPTREDDAADEVRKKRSLTGMGFGVGRSIESGSSINIGKFGTSGAGGGQGHRIPHATESAGNHGPTGGRWKPTIAVTWDNGGSER